MTSLRSARERRTTDFRGFADEHIAPHAAEFDRDQAINVEVIRTLASAGFLAAPIAARRCGGEMDMLAYGLLTEELGRSCQSIRNFVAVTDMVAESLSRWGTDEQKSRWLPEISSGRTVAAFGLTEPEVGSDAADVRTTATLDRDQFVVRGTKKWISFAQLADLFLVFAQYGGGPTAFLVERDTPGLSVEPIEGLLGLRGSMLGEVQLDDCRISERNLLGRPGAGLVFVASSALDLGRYSTAWGCVGLAQACLEESVAYANRRSQYGTLIRNHQLVQRMLADMVTDVEAARLLCRRAGLSKINRDINAVYNTLMAKYRASTVANQAAGDAVQIHGAHGIGPHSAVGRHYRDARVMEIIEGTTQIQQMILGQFSAQLAGRLRIDRGQEVRARD